ncbi:hypothetical protein EDD11_004801 [Mortierella claussenii]|nr:hypothetical protein EDD11_004801 [Mortierella claussenii]
MTSDKKHSGPRDSDKSRGASGHKNKNNVNNFKSNSSLNDTTASLKSLQLGSSTAAAMSTTTPQKNNNSSNKAGKKSKKHTGAVTSTAMGSSSSSVSARKSGGPVLLGMPDSAMECQDDSDPYVTKIGGVPTWLDQDVPAPARYGICGVCGKTMYLLLQAYVPLEKSPYDRVVYVWACNQRLCMRKNGSFRIVRALKLNAEYAQKLEKKSKPAVASIPSAMSTAGLGAPAIAATNPFAAPGAFDMGNALFGGVGAGFSNPFATHSSAPNPCAPPTGFGVGSLASAPAPKSFADVTSVHVPQEESSSESDDEEAPENQDITSREWPEKLPSFDPYYLYITEEVLEDSAALDDEISQRYSHFLALEECVSKSDDDEECNGKSTTATWSGETYEKAALPKGVDKAFQKFTERVQAWPDQCVRYDFPGSPLLFSYSDRTAQTLLPPHTTVHSKHTRPSPHRIPRCPDCKGPRGFEFQLMPNLLSLLDVTSPRYLSEEERKSVKERKGAQVFDTGMEWGTILVYSCAEDCFGRNKAGVAAEGSHGQHKVKYFEEVALVQFEE